ncbi:hypothetical protein PsYK624_155800 [Phanerochaete sordida]|uniref:Uncharacterized protein n=1 Tax=Phanerochaete sordida TaxID=48140 RepID=A0A9P3LL95_9APHY|nr:hypothetical protein PsYK624_155800 [Phanerochaete sordida]
MECCPTELWLKIAGLACTDGGRTGCALSLVSREMRALVGPVRFTSISLTTEEQLHAFSALLSSPGTDSSPTIRHLLVYLETQAEHGSDLDTSSIDSALCHVLSVAAPTVVTLAVHGIRFDLIPPRLPFPSLHDLSIDSTDYSTSLTSPHFTTTRRLHIVRRTFPPHPDFWPDLTRFTPLLTHLRLSCVARDGSVPRFLRILLDVPVLAPSGPMGATDAYAPGSEHARRAAETAARLPALRRVAVQPLLMRVRGMCGTPRIAHGRMLVALDAVARACAEGRGTGTLCVLPGSPSYRVDEARADWVNAVGGGDGAWRAVGAKCGAAE